MENFSESYNGESDRRLIEQVNERNGKDINSHMVKDTTESSLKMTKNHFYFTLKALFVLKIFKFLS